MKKLALSIVAVVLAVASVFCFTACGDTPEQKLKNYIESDTFQSQIDSMKSSFESIADTIKKEVNIETPQVIVEINTKDGKNLVSKTFGASESK